MTPKELAERLATASTTEHPRLLREHAAHVRPELARELKALFDDTKASEPVLAARAATALQAVADAIDDPETSGLASWTAGMAALQRDGQTRRALDLLDHSVSQFEAIRRPDLAASAHVSRIHALALLGDYDQAFATGLQARAVFERIGDDLAAGKIEQNLGNIYWRREQYAEAEQQLRAARDRFERLNDTRQLAQVDNNLAGVLALQHRFEESESHYQLAQQHAEALGQQVTRAEIAVNLGCLALARGDFSRALHELEGARRRYLDLDLPHKLANAEKELADAYVELNLLPEAVDLYQRVRPTFERLGMRAESAWASLQLGRALMLLGRSAEARAQLDAALELFSAERNAVGEAMVIMAESELHLRAADFASAVEAAQRAENRLQRVGSPGRMLLARWQRGEALRCLGDLLGARAILEEVRRAADSGGLPHLSQRCLTSLGLLKTAAGDSDAARTAFERAVELIEALGAPLPADEFRTAFAADKLVPYAELVRLCLASGAPDAVEQAFVLVERARSRALADLMAGDEPLVADEFETKQQARLNALREQLGWLYGRAHRLEQDGGRDARRGGSPTVARVRAAIRERESALLELRRRLAARHRATPSADISTVDDLRQWLPADAALVAYFSLDRQLLAFVVTPSGATLVPGLASEAEVGDALAGLRFQLDSLRHGATRVRRHLPQLTARTQHHLQHLYDLLLRPLEPQLCAAQRVVVVPHRLLHYVPFHALHDGEQYQVQRRELTYAPSAAILRRCLARRATGARALLIGVPDPSTPRVRDEVTRIASLFDLPSIALDRDATVAAVRAGSPQADVLHLATHARFRPDNPLFSALRLADGWLTVRDASELDLSRGVLVVLSACETGVSDVAPGDELLGLARGFFTAGAASLLVSLWPVDDAATSDLMVSFYARLRAGARPAAALRAAQLDLLAQQPHPFFWAPFALHGHW